MPRFAANLSWMLQEFPMLNRFDAARRLGFTAVECQLPYDHSPKVFANACRDSGLEFIMLNAPPGNMAAGEYGLSALPGREQEFRDSIHKALDYATALNSRFIHILAGIVPEDKTREHCHKTYIDNLTWAVALCQQERIGVLIEPINTFEKPGYLTSLTAQALEVLQQINHKNLGIQFDFHNAQLMEGYISRTLETHLSSIHHMQIAGIPGRTPPDQGELNYPYLFNLIDQSGYDGWIGCEYHAGGPQSPSTKSSLKWAQAFSLGK